jgi:two-component system, LuxR family, sensor kinase FixL
MIRLEEMPYVAAFGVAGLFASWLSSSRRQTEVSLQERTAELQKANDALRTEITERERAERKLQERADLLDLTHDTIFVRDMSDAITFWNRAAEEQYGWTSEEAVGRISHEVTRTGFPASLEEITSELTRTGRWQGELVHTRRDGTQVVVASRWALQRDERELPIAILETNTDITERKRAEEALHTAQADLAHVTRVTTMGELAASIAHEVNQPLAAIVTNGNACLRWLSAQPPDMREVREAVQRIIADGNRASEVVAGIRGLLKKTGAMEG